MKRSVIAALGAALIATIGVSSAARAGVIDFGVMVIGGTITYTGTTLEDSTALDIDDALLIVSGVKPGDSSGLAAGDTVSIFAPTAPFTNIIYGTSPLSPEVVVSWTGSNGAFTETLTTVQSINRGSTDAITVTLSGTVLGPGFDNTPISLILSANQDGGPGNITTATFTNSTMVIPETSTWMMMALGFGALGYAASRRRRTKISMPPA